MNEKIRALGNKCFRAIFILMNIKVYIVFIQEILVRICGYFWVQSLCLLSHPITVSQCYVMDKDAALEAQAPEGSSPEGELTGKPYSSNSVAQTNSEAPEVEL